MSKNQSSISQLNKGEEGITFQRALSRLVVSKKADKCSSRTIETYQATVKYLCRWLDEAYPSILYVGQVNQNIDLFLKNRKESSTNYETAIGNLSIAIELMIKNIIAEYCFAFLFKSLPDELFMSLTYPKRLRTKPQIYAIELQTFSYNTIELNEAIGRFYIIFPEKKQEFKPYLSVLSSIRNKSIHACLPSFQRYDLERVAYIAASIFLFLVEEGLYKYAYYLKKSCKIIIGEYEEERVKRVKEAIEHAKSKSKELERIVSPISTEGWEQYITYCPICESDGILDGYTEMSGETVEDEDYELALDFYASSFECTGCGLRLLDVKELQLAGMDLKYDRSEGIQDWMMENADEF